MTIECKPWTQLECEECGYYFQATRTEPSTVSGLCSECSTYKRGYNEQREALWTALKTLKPGRPHNMNSDEILHEMCVNGSSDLQIELAQSPLLTTDWLALLSKSDNSDVRYWVATNPRTNPNTLELLSLDKNRDVRIAVAQNANTLPYVLVNLANLNTDSDIRQTVARHQNTRPETLELLSKDRNWCVREAVAENPNTPANALEVLALDGFWQVRDAARETLKTALANSQLSKTEMPEPQPPTRYTIEQCIEILDIIKELLTNGTTDKLYKEIPDVEPMLTCEEKRLWPSRS